MKNIFLTATIASAIVGTAFGAGSIRAPQFGGGTTTAPATTSVARAGTLRTQTMKTSMSPQNTAPTANASVSEPVATDTTDARLSFLSSKLGKMNVKTTDSAKQELNNIDARIEELQSKLDAAKADAESVVTVDTIDSKIEEKLTELGATAGTKDTYTKEEINKLLPYKEKGLIYLPVLPDQPDPNSGEIGTPVPTVIAPEWRFHLVDSYTIPGGLMTVLVYSTSLDTPSEEVGNFVHEVCGDENDGYWCSQYGSTTNHNTEKWFNIRKRNHGYYLFENDLVQYNGELWELRRYDTNETQANNSSATQAYMNTQICGTAEGTEDCYVLNVNQYAPGMLTPTYQVPMYVKVPTVSELPATSTLITHD